MSPENGHGPDLNRDGDPLDLGVRRREKYGNPAWGYHMVHREKRRSLKSSFMELARFRNEAEAGGPWLDGSVKSPMISGC